MPKFPPPTRENGAVLGASVHGLVCTGWLVGTVHRIWQQLSHFEVATTIIHSPGIYYSV
jgi:hypothetical protein